MPWQTILVPHDFSRCANHAAALARDVAHLVGAKLVVVHVAEIPAQLGTDAAIVPEPGASPIKVGEFALSGAREHLDDLAARLRKDELEVETIATTGRPHEEVLRIADEIGADLIVMGTHGRTGLRHLVTGSVTEKVVRRSPIPVLTVRVPDE